MARPSQPIIDGKKLCTKCLAMFPLDQFYTERRGEKVRLFSACKACCLEALQSYRARNPGKATALAKAWQVANPEKARASGRKCKAKRRDRDYELHRRWCAANPERARELSRKSSARRRAIDPTPFRRRLSEWRKRNKDKVNAWTHKRRAKLKGNGGTFTADEWAVIKARQSYTCLMCRRREPEIKLTIDHVIPVQHGGTNDKSNIQGLCRACNCRKSDATLDLRPAG